MRAEIELRMPYYIEKQIRNYLVRIDYIRSSLLPGGIAYDLDRVQGGFPGDRYANAMGRISEIEDVITKLEQKKDWYENIRIPLLLEQVKKTDAADVLLYHIVMRMPMWMAANKVIVSRSTANRLMREGLQDIQDYLDGRNK